VRGRYAPLVSQLARGALAGDARAIGKAYHTKLGARSTYVADVDAIGGSEPQWDLVRELSDGGVHIWIDAGIACAKSAEAWAALAGIELVVVGLETLPGLEALNEIVAGASEKRVAFSLDLRDGQLVSRAPALCHRYPEEVAAMAADAGAACVIVLDLGRVGSGAGVDELLLGRIAREIPDVELVAGGGISAVGELRRLATLGAHGVLIGSALHDGRIGRLEIDGMAG
jgi:phosphoribosylformimino-5-aminoimidazole carboxamide ribotide isomerase